MNGKKCCQGKDQRSKGAKERKATARSEEDVERREQREDEATGTGFGHVTRKSLDFKDSLKLHSTDVGDGKLTSNQGWL